MTTATAPAETSAARYSESTHVLLDVPMRSAILGYAELEAERVGGRPKEGDMIRTLLEEAIIARTRKQGGRPEYETALVKGRAELDKRAADKRARRAARRGPKA